jgi:hypothetical protein
MRVPLPVTFCPECRTQLVPSTWHVVIATGADVCLFCDRKNHRPGECRQRTHEELGLIALRALSPSN